MVSFKKSVLLYGLTLGLGLSVSINACYAAPSVLDPACDTAFMATLKDKAWMETQRETMIAQSIIAKPDSVFDLTCFGSAITLMGTLTKLTVPGDTSLTDLNTYLGNYLTGSFLHDLGGGHVKSPPKIKGLTDNPCEVMGKLWQAAKCANASLGAIMGLDGYKSTDTRTFAMTACSNTGAWATAPTDPWNTLVTVGAVNTTKFPGPTVYFDKMNLFSANTAPLSQTGPPIKCSAPISTGVMIGTIPEAVCSNPGCTSTGATTPMCCQTGTTSGSTCS